MASGRILHSGNLVRGFQVGDRKLFMEKYYDPKPTEKKALAIVIV